MTREERRLVTEAWEHSLYGRARIICLAAGLTAEDIAERTGVSPVTAWRWIEGRSQMRGRTGLAYAELLREAIPRALPNLHRADDEVARRRKDLDEYEQALAQLRALTPAPTTAAAA